MCQGGAGRSKGEGRVLAREGGCWGGHEAAREGQRCTELERVGMKEGGHTEGQSGREPGRERARQGRCWGGRAQGRDSARESQGGKEGARESHCTLPPSLALPHAPREGGRA
jgi:hypothetical protein